MRQILLNATQRHLFWHFLWGDTVPESHPSCTRSSAVVQSHYHLQAGGIEQRITPATVKYCLTLSHYPKAPLFTSQPCIHHFQILEQLCCLSVHTHSMCGCYMLATTFSCCVYVCTICVSSCPVHICWTKGITRICILIEFVFLNIIWTWIWPEILLH